MGIAGLRGLLKDVSIKNVVFSDHFHMCVVQVDAFGWIHRLLARYAVDVVENDNFESIVVELINQVVFCAQRGVRILSIFDGRKMQGT